MTETEPDKRILTLQQAVVTGRLDKALSVLEEISVTSGPDAVALTEQAGAVLCRLYSSFHGTTVEQIFGALSGVAAGPLARIRLTLQSDVETTMSWRRRLSGLSNERLANSLVDAMKAANMPGVNSCLQALIGLASSESDRVQRVRQAGSLLGGLVAERERASAFVRTLVSSPDRYGLSPVEAMAMFEEYSRSASTATVRRQDGAAALRVELTQAVVELGRSLPGRMELREPTDAQVLAFDRQARALLRCAVGSQDHALLPDVVMILSEFAPRTVGMTGAMAGVEQRLWMTLGRTARMTAVRVLGDIGKEPTISRLFLEFATENVPTGTRLGRMSVETLGVLHLSSAEPFLIRALQAKGSKARLEAAYALGAIAGPKGLEALLVFLRELMGMKVLDADNRRLAFSIVEAIGRTLRNQPPAERNSLTERILKAVPADETDFRVAVLMNFFWTKLDVVSPNLRDWAARTATDMLWLPDQHLLATRGANTPLGWRQPLVDLLIRLMPYCTPTIVQTATGNLGRYCGAYLALGEMCGRIANSALLPLLRQMVVQVGLQDDSHHGARDAYKQETVYDPTTETHVPLTRDAVLVSIIHGVSQQAGDEGEELLSEIYKMAQSKRLPMPGRESASVLMEAHMRFLKRQGASSKMALEAVGAEVPNVSSGQVAAMIADLSGSFWFAGKRRQKRVAALAGLASAGEKSAMPRMVELLSDVDLIIAGAALTALLDLLKVINKDPMDVENLQDHLLRELSLTTNAPGRDRIAGLLARMKPAQSPLREKIEQLLSNSKTSSAVKLALGRTVLPRIAAADDKAQTQDDAPQDERTPPADDAETPEQMIDPEASNAFKKFLPTRGLHGQQAVVSALDKKRAYMLARQEWIRNGKHGPEPQPPQ